MATSLEGVDVVWSGPVPSIRHEAAVPLRILLLRGRRLGPFAPSLLPWKMLGGGRGAGQLRGPGRTWRAAPRVSVLPRGQPSVAGCRSWRTLRTMTWEPFMLLGIFVAAALPARPSYYRGRWDLGGAAVQGGEIVGSMGAGGCFGKGQSP